MNSKTNYLKEHQTLIEDLISKNTPKAEICRVLRIKPETLNSFLKSIGVDYKGNSGRKGRPHFSERISVYYYLENNKIINASKLRKLLIRDGLKEEKCECCGLTEWMGKKIPLELHHVNFNHNDNRLENLQILCSNCHGIAHDYCNTKYTKESSIDMDALEDILNPKEIDTKFFPKKKQKGPEKEKNETEKTKRNKSINPTEKEMEYHIRERKCERPSKEELNKLICEKPFLQIGRMYGVSDNAVRKWCKQYGLKYRKKDIKATP